MAVGGIHPDTGHVYEWLPGHSPDEIEIAALPHWVIEKLQAKNQPREKKGTKPAPEAGKQTRKQRKPSARTGDQARSKEILRSESKAVAATPEGNRNNRLSQAAFTAGGLVATGLDEKFVRKQLQAAGKRAGLEDAEIIKTIDSGIQAGKDKPIESYESRAWDLYKHFVSEWQPILRPPCAVSCWHVLFASANKTSFKARLSYKQIAALLCAKRNTAIVAVRALCDSGLVVIVHLGGSNEGEKNEYRLTFPEAAEKQEG